MSDGKIVKMVEDAGQPSRDVLKLLDDARSAAEQYSARALVVIMVTGDRSTMRVHHSEDGIQAHMLCCQMDIAKLDIQSDL